MIGKHFGVNILAKGGGEENPQITEGEGGVEEKGRSMGAGDGEGGGHGASMGGVATRRVKEHEFCFVSIGKEAKGVEPGEDFRDGVGEMCSCCSICWTRGVDGPIVDIEGEVLLVPPCGFVKERGGEEGQENGGWG